MKNDQFFAGAGRGVIRYPREAFPFSEGPDTWTGVHDDPCVRVVVLECGIRAAIVSLEIVILDENMAQRTREAVSRLTGTAPENIWLSATHTVTTPHLFIRDHNPPEENARAAMLQEKIMDAVREAAAAAAELRPAKLGHACGVCAANVNRVIPTCDGWWLGSGEEFAAERSVPVIRIDANDGNPIALLYSYCSELAVMDKSVMADGGRHITADLAGAASRFVEQQYDDETVALFLPGVPTDMGPAYRAVRTVRGRNGTYHSVDIQDQGWLLLELLGERLGEQVLVAAEKAECADPDAPLRLYYDSFRFPGQKLRGLPNPMRGPVKDWVSVPDAERTRSVNVLRLGDVTIAAVGGLCVRTMQKLKAASPFAGTVVIEGVSGSAPALPTDGAKYMAESDLYAVGAFQARNSEFAAGSAEMMLEDAIKLLHDIAKEEREE